MPATEVANPTSTSEKVTPTIVLVKAPTPISHCLVVKAKPLLPAPLLRDAGYKTFLRDAEYETEIASLSCAMYTHATADKFGGQCVNSCSGRSENIWASDMWVKLLSPSLLLFLFHPLFLNPLFLLLSSSNIIKPHVNIWSSDVIKWGWLCPELSDSPQAWGLAYRVIQSFVLLTCLPLRLFHLLSLIFWFVCTFHPI